MTTKDKLAIMREIEQRNTERLREAGLRCQTEREEQNHEKSA